MEYTAIAQWLNTFFAGYDSAILSSLAKLADAAGSFLTPVMKFVTLLGEKGLMMFIIALVCMCFARTRKLGVCMFGAVCCGALITNIILKDMVARPRPFEFSSQFHSFWMAVGSPAEDGFSFPSGHVTAATAGVAALCFVEGKKWIAPSVIWVVLMGVSRNYLMAHFPSDVLFAIIIGLFSAFVAYLITKAIFNYVEDNDDFPIYNFIMNFSIPLPNFAAIGGRIADTGKSAAGAAKSAMGAVKLPGRRAEASPAREARHARPAESSGRFEAVGGASRSEKRRAGAAAGLSRATAGFNRAAESADAPTEAKKPAFRTMPRAEAKKSTSDWSARWETYRSTHSPNGAPNESARPYVPKAAPESAPGVRGASAAPFTVQAESAPRVDPRPAAMVDDDGEDADMKIAAPRTKSRTADALAARGETIIAPAVKVESAAEPVRAASAAPKSEPVSAADFDDDGIDWARLGLDLSSIGMNDGTSAELDEPVRRRSASRSSTRSGSGAYRGRHER